MTKRKEERVLGDGAKGDIGGDVDAPAEPELDLGEKS